MAKAYKRQTEMNIFVRCALAVFLAACVFGSVRELMKYNENQERIAELTEKKAEYEERIERLEYELDCEFNDEYVIRIAKEKLNLCMPSEAVYYNGLE